MDHHLGGGLHSDCSAYPALYAHPDVDHHAHFFAPTGGGAAYDRDAYDECNFDGDGEGGEEGEEAGGRSSCNSDPALIEPSSYLDFSAQEWAYDYTALTASCGQELPDLIRCIQRSCLSDYAHAGEGGGGDEEEGPYVDEGETGSHVQDDFESASLAADGDGEGIVDGDNDEWGEDVLADASHRFWSGLEGQWDSEPSFAADATIALPEAAHGASSALARSVGSIESLINPALLHLHRSDVGGGGGGDSSVDAVRVVLLGMSENGRPSVGIDLGLACTSSVNSEDPNSGISPVCLRDSSFGSGEADGSSMHTLPMPCPQRPVRSIRPKSPFCFAMHLREKPLFSELAQHHSQTMIFNGGIDASDRPSKFSASLSQLKAAEDTEFVISTMLSLPGVDDRDARMVSWVARMRETDGACLRA
jgi:hypothetical protein